MLIESPDEMFIEPDYFTMDIRTFILSLPEPKRSICRAVILEGEKIADVRKIYGVTRWQLIEIIRDALMPLARDYRIGQFRQNDGRVTGKGRGDAQGDQGGSTGEGSRGVDRVLPNQKSPTDYRGSSRKIRETFFSQPQNPKNGPLTND